MVFVMERGIKMEIDRFEFLLVLTGYVLGQGVDPDDANIIVDQHLTGRNSPCMTLAELKKLSEVMDPIVDWMLLTAGNRKVRRGVRIKK